MKKKSSIMRVACSVVLALAFVGCSNEEATKKIKAFSSATDTIIQNTNNAFDMVERSYEDAELEWVVANYDKGFAPEKIKKFFPAKDLEARKLVLAGLKQYASSLAAIMSNDKLEEFDTSTKALGKSLTTIDATLVKEHILTHKVASDTDINIFTTAVNTLGRWFIDFKRTKVVKENVFQMQKTVRNISMLFVKDIGAAPYNESADAAESAKLTASRLKLGLRAQLWNNYSELIRIKANFIDHNKDHLSPIEKRDEIKKLVGLLNDRKTADDTIKAVAKSFQQLAVTHDQLVNAFDKKDLSLVDSISELIAEGERIKTFYEDLGK